MASKEIDFNPFYILIITLNMNDLKVQVKRVSQIQQESKTPNWPSTKTYSKHNDIDKLKVKGETKV